MSDLKRPLHSPALASGRSRSFG